MNRKRRRRRIIVEADVGLVNPSSTGEAAMANDPSAALNDKIEVDSNNIVNGVLGATKKLIQRDPTLAELANIGMDKLLAAVDKAELLHEIVSPDYRTDNDRVAKEYANLFMTKTKFENLAASRKEKLDQLKNDPSFKDVAQMLYTYIKNMFQSIYQSIIPQSVRDAIHRMFAKMTELLDRLWSWIKQKWNEWFGNPDSISGEISAQEGISGGIGGESKISANAESGGNISGGIGAIMEQSADQALSEAKSIAIKIVYCLFGFVVCSLLLFFLTREERAAYITSNLVGYICARASFIIEQDFMQDIISGFFNIALFPFKAVFNGFSSALSKAVNKKDAGAILAGGLGLVCLGFMGYYSYRLVATLLQKKKTTIPETSNNLEVKDEKTPTVDLGEEATSHAQATADEFEEGVRSTPNLYDYGKADRNLKEAIKSGDPEAIAKAKAVKDKYDAEALKAVEHYGASYNELNKGIKALEDYWDKNPESDPRK